ncbi:MAG: hypothetical protein ACTSWW_09955 [Promethearchaeota archaeon]
MVHEEKPGVKKFIHLALSYFDFVLGPRHILTVPGDLTNKKNHFVAQFFDFHQNGDFFMHVFEDYLSFNHLFSTKMFSDHLRGGKRLLMLTASIPLTVMRRKDLLQYFPSLKQLFRDWSKNFDHNPKLSAGIQDGKKILIEQDVFRPLIHELNLFLTELEFIIQIAVPDTVQIPADFIAPGS